jgi:16S rRNA (guanine(966)-N(2))-methyltransferase RsmD
MAKESLFNILDNHIYFEDTRVLDLYAGTGSISYEFASRGCQQVVAVDINPRCVKFISETATKLGFSHLLAIRSTSIGFLNHCTNKFSVIFADPPYDLEGIDEVVALVFGRQLLAEGGFLIVEHSVGHDYSTFPGFWQRRQYGKVNFTFFRK